jgi:uncharacterized protein
MNSPAYRKITADQLAVVPWKNGGGVTTEIAAGPSRSDDQDWSWRVSVADVGATGAFSAFPGIDRTIAVIEGGGMDLQFDNGRMVPLELNRPVDFDGGDAVTGILRDDAIRDFNVMVDRRSYSARLDIIQKSQTMTISRRLSAGDVLLVHVLDGDCAVAWGGRDDPLGRDETAIFEGVAEVSVSVFADARVAVATLKSVSTPGC